MLRDGRVRGLLSMRAVPFHARHTSLYPAIPTQGDAVVELLREAVRQSRIAIKRILRALGYDVDDDDDDDRLKPA